VRPIHDLASRVVVVTGGAQGIGRATATLLADAGALVAILDVDGPAAQGVAAALPRAQAWELDVADRATFTQVVPAIEARMGPIDVLINNAAVMALGPLVDVSEHQVRRQIETNLIGVVHGMQLVLPMMVARDRGHVININSGAGRWAIPGENVYVATKHAVVGLTGVARAELRGTGVHTSLVYMGPVEGTGLAAGMHPTRSIRMSRPEDVATAVVRLIRRPRPEVWIPRSAGRLSALGRHLPARAALALERVIGLDRIATDIDADARLDYEAQAFEARPGRPGQQERHIDN
jgi:NADP-dependent 3-hydroxy acid dehydrogenase YdfG